MRIGSIVAAVNRVEGKHSGLGASSFGEPVANNHAATCMPSYVNED